MVYSSKPLSIHSDPCLQYHRLNTFRVNNENIYIYIFTTNNTVNNILMT